MEWINRARDMTQWRAVVNSVVCRQFRKHVGRLVYSSAWQHSTVLAVVHPHAFVYDIEQL
jgi:hypothetical protein